MGLPTVVVQTQVRRDHAESRTRRHRDHLPLVTPWEVSHARSTAVNASQRTFGTGVFVRVQISATAAARGVGARTAGGAGCPGATGGVPTAGCGPGTPAVTFCGWACAPLVAPCHH